MTPIIHNYSDLAGTKQLWDFGDTQELFKKHCADPAQQQTLETLGYLNRNIVYRFNSHGFRGPEFPEYTDVVCFGCSFTLGTGVDEEHTWPSQLAQLSQLNIVNLGHAGSSNDTAFRFAEYYLPKLKPKFAVWLQTDPHRLELIDESSGNVMNLHHGDTTNPCANDYFTKVWFSSFENQRLNLAKNTLAFEHLCAQLNIHSVVVERSQVNQIDLARDLRHPGVKSLKQLATMINHRIASILDR